MANCEYPLCKKALPKPKKKRGRGRPQRFCDMSCARKNWELLHPRRRVYVGQA